MTPTDILSAAATHGFSFEIAAAAIQTCEDEQREGSTYWDGRGPLALLTATRGSMEPVELSLRETLDATQVRY
jgi:hypothetical protein